MIAKIGKAIEIRIDTKKLEWPRQKGVMCSQCGGMIETEIFYGIEYSYKLSAARASWKICCENGHEEMYQQIHRG